MSPQKQEAAQSAPTSSTKKRRRAKHKAKAQEAAQPAAHNPEVPFTIPKKLLLNKPAKNQGISAKKGGGRDNDENANSKAQGGEPLKEIVSPLKQMANSNNAQNIQNNQAEEK